MLNSRKKQLPLSFYVHLWKKKNMDVLVWFCAKIFEMFDVLYRFVLHFIRLEFIGRNFYFRI